MHRDCINCFIGQAERLIDELNISDQTVIDAIRQFCTSINSRKYRNMLAPEASCIMHRLIKSVIMDADPYERKKKEFNELLLGLEEQIREIIRKSADPFMTALRYALAGNVIDLGPPQNFNVSRALASALSIKPAIDHTTLLRKEVQHATTVLYLGDNAGEIVLDKLLIETIRHPNLYFAVRGSHVINDVTMEDALLVGMTDVAKVISNGYDAPSTLIKYCSAEFRKIYDEADVVISKGQGNLEGLMDDTDKKIFFLLMVKCNVMAELTGVKKGNAIVMHNKRIRWPQTN